LQAGDLPAVPAPAAGAVRDFRLFLLVEARWAPTTVEVSLRQLDFLQRTFGLRPAEFSYDAGRELLGERRAAGASVWAYNSDVKVLNRLAEWRGEERRFRKLPVPQTEVRSLSEGEASTLMAYRHQDPSINAFRRALVLWSLVSGMRNSEVARMDVDHLSLSGRWFTVAHPAKRGLPRDLPLEAWVCGPKSPLAAWLRRRPAPAGDPGALWVVTSDGQKHVAPRRAGKEYLRKVLAEVGHATLGRPFSFTVGRHTCAFALMDAEHPLPYVQYWLGHKSAASTAIYTRVRADNVFMMMQRRPRRSVLQGGQE
jgi:integrase